MLPAEPVHTSVLETRKRPMGLKHFTTATSYFSQVAAHVHLAQHQGQSDQTKQYLTPRTKAPVDLYTQNQLNERPHVLVLPSTCDLGLDDEGYQGCSVPCCPQSRDRLTV